MRSAPARSGVVDKWSTDYKSHNSIARRGVLVGAENDARKPESWAPTVLLLAAGAIAEFLYPMLISESRLGRWVEGALTVAILFGVCWAVGALVNLVTARPWKSPSSKTISVVIAVMVVNAIVLHFNDMLPGRTPSGSGATAEVSAPSSGGGEAGVRVEPAGGDVVNADGLAPYHGKVIPTDTCLEGQRRMQGHCVDPAFRVVRRGTLGRCPSGYVDHPAHPALCALPIVAERISSNR